ncbi:putative late blight resistance protein homolog R1A-3 [Primulina tabacum]|uniref:putative late blight resistance protein homolog R1A-3 n=1 Tax=Primulina tabacum TaxID=48773 RepID=UPI003F5972AF
MAAYAALLSLARSLHQILEFQQDINPLHIERIASLREKVNSIVRFLEDYSEKHRGTLHRVGNEIGKAVNEAQDFMDSYLYSVIRTREDWSSSEASCDEESLDQNLDMAFASISFMWEVVMKIKNDTAADDLHSRTYYSPVDDSSTVQITAKNMVVGFDDDLNAIKERLYEDSAKLQIISIVGMGGIGKTTLARRAHEDSLLAQYFDICAWITVSAEYQRREIFWGLLQYFKKPNDEELVDESEGQLAKLVHQNLIGRRYLIVIDDIWSTKAWDDLKMIFPDDGSGSRILLTTRISDVAVHAGSSSSPFHQMNFLNEDQSWTLLQKKHFGQESCPPQLVEIGKKIARNCGGLPLTIVVVAGLLLSSSDMTKEELWENVSENIISMEPTIELQCSKILCLSYDRLPIWLKPCFLYITAFPEDYNIDVSKLIKLWVAEGFLKPSDQSKCLEDVGEQYLEDLVHRNMILVRQKGPDEKLETVGVHDMLREICTTEAEKEGFLHHVSSKTNAHKEAAAYRNRRLSIHCTWSFNKWQILDSSMRSLLLFSDTLLFSSLSLSWRRLSILDALITWLNFSDVISSFVNLRYIVFVLNHLSCPHGFPASISKLPNLQTIIAHITDFGPQLQVPYEIWGLPKLRHLIIDTPFHLVHPSSNKMVTQSELQTLEAVIDFEFAEESIKILANLKKLKVVFRERRKQNDLHLHNLFRLRNLKELQLSMDYWRNPSMIWNYDFPMSLKKLTLQGVPLPWDNIGIIGSLPNLQVLEMMNIGVIEVSEWATKEGQFLQLKYFRSSLDYLVKWEVEKEHFPILESLILERAHLIDEIPCGIGEIDSLKLIELHCCSVSLADSAKRIQEQQHENGDCDFQVRLI